MQENRRGFKIIKFFGLLFVIMICVAISGYEIIKAYNNGLINSAFASDEREDSIICGDGLNLKQHLTLEENMIRGFALNFDFSEYADINGEIIATLYNEKQEIMAQTMVSAAGLVNDDYILLGFDHVIKNCQGQKVMLKLDFRNFTYKDMVVLKAVDKTDDGKLFINDGEDSRNIMLSVISAGPDGYFKLICTVYILLSFTIVLVYILVSMGRFSSKLKIEQLYLIVAILLGITYSLMIPVMGVPDEGTHMFSAYQLSNEMMGVESDLYKVTVRQADYDHKFAITEFDRGYYDYYLDGIFHRIPKGSADSELVVGYGQYGCNAPKFLYVFGALGITLGRLLSLGTVMTYLLGRLFNTLFFAFVTYYAIKKIPFGKCLVAVWALLPITIQQVNSYSYDCLVNALSILVTSLTLFFMFGDVNMKHYQGRFRRIKSLIRLDVIVYGLSLLFIIPCKQHALVPIAFLSLMFVVKWAKENKARINSFKQRINKWIRIAFYLGLAAAVCLVGAFVLIKAKAILTAPSEPHIVEWAKEPGYTLSYLLANPVAFVQLIINTFLVLGDAYFVQMFGGKLGWLDMSIPLIFIWPFVILIILSTLSRSDEEIKLTISNRIWMILMAMLVIGFTVMGMLLNWTPLSFSHVEGVQGRYFLPVMVLFLLGLRTKSASISKEADKPIIFTAVFMQIFIVMSYFTNVM